MRDNLMTILCPYMGWSNWSGAFKKLRVSFYTEPFMYKKNALVVPLGRAICFGKLVATDFLKVASEKFGPD